MQVGFLDRCRDRPPFYCMNGLASLGIVYREIVLPRTAVPRKREQASGA
jgi:hypothetical protein